MDLQDTRSESEIAQDSEEKQVSLRDGYASYDSEKTLNDFDSEERDKHADE